MKKTAYCLLPATLLSIYTIAQPGPPPNPGIRPVSDTRPAPHQSHPMPTDKNHVMDFFQNQQFEEAISYLGPALDEDSTNIPVLGYLGYAYYNLDNNKASESCYQRIFELDSANVSALYYLEILTTHEDPDKAFDFTSRLVELQPAKSLWWRIRGDLQRRLKQPDSALYSLTHAYTLAPGEAKNVAALADLLIEKKSYRQADSILEIKLEKDSLSIPLLKLRMRSAYSARDYEAVLIPGERIMRQHVADINAQTWLALSYYNLEKYTDCIRVCGFLMDNGYDTEAIYYYEARALAKLQQYAESNTLLAICLQKAISHTADWYYTDLGENHEAMKGFRSAIACYDTAYYIFREPIMLYNCGRIAESELKNNTLARKYYARYLALAHPDTPEEKKAYLYVKEHWGMRRIKSETGKHTK